jgi:hypothetical protein
MKYIIIFVCLLISVISYGAVYTTTNTFNAGPGSLRQAILDANAVAGSTIAFNIPPEDARHSFISSQDHVWTIKPTANLPAITGAYTYLNGNSQSVNVSSVNSRGPEIEINACLLTASPIDITSDHVRIEGVCISSYSGGIAGINCAVAGASSATIQGCYIGLNSTGTKTYDCIGNGISFSNASWNIIGSTTDATLKNVIGGQTQSGTTYPSAIGMFASDNNKILGNYIGVNYDATLNLSKTTYRSVLFQFGATDILIQGNVIGNIEVGGCFAQADSSNARNVVQSNWFCTNQSQTAVLSNASGIPAILLDTGNSVLVNRNIIKFVIGNGISITTSSNTITDNLISSGTGTSNGILVTTGKCNLISRNAIYQNATADIALASGGNSSSIRPWISSATTAVILGTSPASAIIEVFVTSGMAVRTSNNRGGSVTFIGSTTANGSGNWTLTLASPYSAYTVANDSVTATSTIPNNNTSTFSINRFMSAVSGTVSATRLPFIPKVIIY